MRKEWGKIHMIAILIASIVICNGCKIQMSVPDRLGVDSGKIETDLIIENPENNQAASLTVKYQPYDLNVLANEFFDINAEMVNDIKVDDFSLYLESDIENIPIYKHKGIVVFDGSSSFIFCGQEDADQYLRIVGNSNGGEWYTYASSNLREHFPVKEINGCSIDEAKIQIIEKLESAGLKIAYGDVCVLDLDSLKDAGMECWGFARDEHGYPLENTTRHLTEEYQVYYYIFKTMYDGCIIEDIMNESLIQVAYSPYREEIMYAMVLIPVLTEQIVKEDVYDVISGEDALALGAEMVGLNKITDVELVYVRQIGSINFTEQTIRLDPAWKVSYTTKVNKQTVTNYLLFNAANGQRITNATSLY